MAMISENSIDMRTFARNVGTTITFNPGQVIFREGDSGEHMFVVQEGTVDMVIGASVVDVCKAGDALGFMAVIDKHPRTSTAVARERMVLSVIDDRRLKFMIDEISNFSFYIMSTMAHRIRGMGKVIAH